MSFWFRPSKPRVAKGGIRAQSKRGEFAQSWWAKRWIAVIETFSDSARLGRGRSYARNGQVLSIDIEEGLVKAKVQGSRPKPYEVVMKVKTLSAADWTKLTRALSSRVIYAAKLLAGEMPREIEEVFKEAGLSLFPVTSKDLATNCSCPDWSNPCKHIAAVHYLLGEEFDGNPFLIFKLRGMDREDLLAKLGDAGKSAAQKARRTADGGDSKKEAPPAAEPLSPDGPAFWKGGDLPDDGPGEAPVPPIGAALLLRLGPFSFWRGHLSPREALEPVYGRASLHGVEVFLSGRG